MPPVAPIFFNTGGHMSKKKIKELIKELKAEGYPKKFIEEIIQALTPTVK